jgi:hypothetical protein
VRHLIDLPLLARIGPRDALASAGILDVAAAVPFEPPNIEGIVKQTGAAFGLTADCGVAPWPAVWARYALRIKLLGDRARALPVGKLSEYAADDGGFYRIDLPFTGRGGDEAYCPGFPAGAFFMTHTNLTSA